MEKKLGYVNVSRECLEMQYQAVMSNLEQTRLELNNARLAKWKHRMRHSDQDCYKWLGNTKAGTNLNIGGATNAPDSLKVLKDFWTKVWNRDTNWEGSFAQCQPHLQPGKPWVYTELATEEIQAVLSKCQGKAAGLDGWHGSEAAFLPQTVIEELQKHFTLYEKSSLIPSEWTKCKQIHIPKRCFSENPKDYRQVVILSIWYRLWASSRMKRRLVSGCRVGSPKRPLLGKKVAIYMMC